MREEFIKNERKTGCDGADPPLPSLTISLAADLAAANPTYVWWAALTAVTACHALLSVRFARRSAGAVPSWALGYVVVFSVAAFVRSAFVVRWSSRPHACLFDTPCVTRHSRSAQHTSAKPTRLALACADRVLGSDLFDRLVANCAEVSFGALIAEVSGFHLDILGLRWLPAVARLCAWPIVLAQACCWTGEISDNKLWHVVEESLWGGTFALHTALACAALLQPADGKAPSSLRPPPTPPSSPPLLFLPPRFLPPPPPLFLPPRLLRLPLSSSPSSSSLPSLPSPSPHHRVRLPPPLRQPPPLAATSSPSPPSPQHTSTS